MEIKKEIQICFIESYPSVQEGLFQLLGISKSALKKFKLPKKFLEKSIREKDEISFSLNLINQGEIYPFNRSSEVKVLLENSDLFFLSKPFNTHSHPLSYLEEDNLLVKFMGTEYQKYLKVNSKAYDRGLLYRLDYETSGLIAFAKSDDVYNEIRSQFHELCKEKYYLAVVQGEIKKGIKSLTHFLKPSQSKGAKILALNEEELQSQKAQIDIEPLQYNEKENLSLIKVKLGQGHRHQIRVQLSSLGHPILGDELYGGSKAKRLYLHCYEYHLHYNGEELKANDSDFTLLSDFFDFNC